MQRTIKKIIAEPIKMLYAKMYSTQYAKSIGVKIRGKVKIYGTSYGMFSTEPWLITLGNNVHIVGGTLFLTHDGGTLILRDKIPDLELTAPIIVGDNVYIGARTIIMPGVTIGNNVIIGAGAIVTKNIPNNSVAAGVPAKVIKSIDEYLKKASNNSLHIGHLYGNHKADKLKQIFNISRS